MLHSPEEIKWRWRSKKSTLLSLLANAPVSFLDKLEAWAFGECATPPAGLFLQDRDTFEI